MKLFAEWNKNKFGTVQQKMRELYKKIARYSETLNRQKNHKPLVSTDISWKRFEKLNIDFLEV